MQINETDKNDVILTLFVKKTAQRKQRLRGKDRVRIDVCELTVGMYVLELDESWENTPFLFRGFQIRTLKELERIRQVAKHAWVEARSLPDGVPGDTHAELVPLIGKVDFRQEIEQAQQTWGEALEVSRGLLDAVRLGQALDIPGVKRTIEKCVDSILRNPAAMLWLTQIRNKDDYTAEHSLRTAIYAISLGRRLDMLPRELVDIGMCGMLHDLGKIKVPLPILTKNGRLSADEYLIMQTHADSGRKLLMSTSDVPPAAVDAAYCHHERLDGSGYPRGLRHDKIPQVAKLVAIVDAYDAITSDRVYSKGRSSLEALRIIFDAAGTHFDEEMVAHFVKLIGIYPPGEIAELSNGEIGIIIGCPPGNKLKPKLLRVLDADKQPCRERVIDLATNPKDDQGKPYYLYLVHPSGAFGIDIEHYRRKGLLVPENL